MIAGVLLGHCSHFTYANCTKWKSKCEKCPEKDRYPKSLIDNSKKNYELKKQLFKGIKNLTIVTPSEWLANLVKKSFLKEYEIKVINNGIDLNVFKPTYDENTYEKYNIPRNKKIILGVASVWNERKGLQYFEELSKYLDDKNEIIVMVGLNKKQIKCLPCNIIGIGKVEDTKDLVKIYSISDVCFNPSVEETFSLVTLEALACGTPCIVMNSTATPELIRNKECGIIEKEFTIDKIYDDIKRVIKNKNERTLVKFTERYDKKIIQQYIMLYEETGE